MKVIFLIPTLARGGGERVVSELSLHLPENTERIIVLFDKQVSYPYKGKLVSLDIPLGNALPLKIYYFFVALLRFRKIVKKEKPDWVVSFIRPANIINVLSGAKAVLRVDSFLSSVPGFAYKVLTRLFYNKAFKIVCVSEASAKDLTDSFGVKKEKIKVIYNPLNIAQIKQESKKDLPAECREIFEKPVIINVGKFTKGKNHLSLIKVFAEVKKEISQAQLVILGTGESEQELKQLIKDLKLQDSVHLLGWQDNPFKFLARAKVFVSASLREGLPYGILEAMACGLPVVSADCQSGPKEILAPETDIQKEIKDIEYARFGVLTPSIGAKDNIKEGLAAGEEMLKQAVIKILTDEGLRLSLSEKSRARADCFDIKNIIKQWEFLYAREH